MFCTSICLTSQRRRKTFKTCGAIAKGWIFKKAILGGLLRKSLQKWWCHGTTGTTAYDGTVRIYCLSNRFVVVHMSSIGCPTPYEIEQS